MRAELGMEDRANITSILLNRFLVSPRNNCREYIKIRGRPGYRMEEWPELEPHNQMITNLMPSRMEVSVF